LIAVTSCHAYRGATAGSIRVTVRPEINQEESAERCGLHRTYYSGIERGVRNVSLLNIERVAKWLKTSLPELFGRL